MSAIALAVGLIFGLGLGVSGMAQASKVLGFLDLKGAWDPSLAFVMAGAIPMFALCFWGSRRRSGPLVGGGAFPTLATTGIDRRLLGGAALFGVGWGLSGVCPGPALVSLASLEQGALTFAGAMFVGMAAFGLLTALGGPTKID